MMSSAGSSCRPKCVRCVDLALIHGSRTNLTWETVLLPVKNFEFGANVVFMNLVGVRRFHRPQTSAISGTNPVSLPAG